MLSTYQFPRLLGASSNRVEWLSCLQHGLFENIVVVGTISRRDIADREGLAGFQRRPEGANGSFPNFCSLSCRSGRATLRKLHLPLSPLKADAFRHSRINLEMSFASSSLSHHCIEPMYSSIYFRFRASGAVIAGCFLACSTTSCANVFCRRDFRV